MSRGNMFQKMNQKLKISVYQKLQRLSEEWPYGHKQLI